MSKEAMKLALEALKAPSPMGNYKAITALEEALAKEEPVAIDITIDDDDALSYLRDMVVQSDGDLTPIRLLVGEWHSGYGLYIASADYPEEGAVKIADVAASKTATQPEEEQEKGSTPEDPMDTPLPCDVTVGHVNIRKGVALRTLVARMQVLYDMAQATQSQGEPLKVHDAQCPALIGDRCDCSASPKVVDKAWAQFCGGIGLGPDAPYPGMIEAFELHYGQSFTDKDWREETSVWAAAWKAAKATKPKQEQGEPVANASTWFALVMNAAAELENASIFLRDEDAKRVAISGAKYYRDQASALYTTPQQRKPLWIDPNDKTQEKFLPNIGEPVIFCCRGETYIGWHTGGGFQDAFNSENYFNTWSCRWMPIPFIEAAHSSKD